MQHAREINCCLPARRRDGVRENFLVLKFRGGIIRVNFGPSIRLVRPNITRWVERCWRNRLPKILATDWIKRINRDLCQPLARRLGINLPVRSQIKPHVHRAFDWPQHLRDGQIEDVVTVIVPIEQNRDGVLPVKIVLLFIFPLRID